MYNFHGNLAVASVDLVLFEIDVFLSLQLTISAVFQLLALTGIYVMLQPSMNAGFARPLFV